MDRELTRDVDLHSVKRVAEVRASVANELLEAGWILHDIYFATDGDYKSTYILVCLDEPKCPKCGCTAKIEILDFGDRVRYVCTRECNFPGLESQPQPRL